MTEEISTWNLLAIIVLCVSLCIALFINAVSVFTILTKKQFHTAVNMYQLSNSLLIFIMITTKGWIFPLRISGSKALQTSLETTLLSTAIFSINTSIVAHDSAKALEKYMAISRPIRMRTSTWRKRCGLTVVFMWLLLFLFCAPTLLCNLILADTNTSNARFRGGFSNFTVGTTHEAYPQKQSVGNKTAHHDACQAYFSYYNLLHFMLLFIVPSILKLGLFVQTVRRLRHTVTENEMYDTVKKLRTARRKKLEDGTKCFEKVIRQSPFNKTEETCQPKDPDEKREALDVNHIKNFKLKELFGLFGKSTKANAPVTDVEKSVAKRRDIYTMIFPAITFTAIASPNLSFVNSQASRRPECNRTEKDFAKENPEIYRLRIRKRTKRSRIIPTWMWRNRIKAVQNLVVTMTIFCIQWLPYHLLIIYCVSHSRNWQSVSVYFNGFYCALVCATDPIVHCVCSTSFSKALMANIKCVLTCGLIKPVPRRIRRSTIVRSQYISSLHTTSRRLSSLSGKLTIHPDIKHTSQHTN